MASRKFNKTLTFGIMFERFVRENCPSDVSGNASAIFACDVAKLIQLVNDRAQTATRLTGRFTVRDERRDGRLIAQIEELGGRMGFAVDFPSLYARLQKDGQEVRLPLDD